jgi:CheY-like chemotaxis protein
MQVVEDGNGSPPRGVVLHLEDDDDSRTAICKFLNGAGYRCLEAKSPEIALQLAAEWGPKLDLLIVDYDLGAELTGTETVESISRRLGHSLPTIILTGNPANADVPWLRNSPIWIAAKPVCPDALLAGVPPLVEFRRAMKAATSKE